MTSPAYCLFETAIGACAIVWGERGLTGVYLPEANADRLRARILRRHPDAAEAEPSSELAQAIAEIAALLDGEPRDLRGIALDLDRVGEFERRVYEIARAIPPGSTLTYGDIARKLGDPGAAQAVGQAMGRNPCPIVVPCHRVLGAGGKLGGFSAPGGSKTKLRMLEIEGALKPEALPLFGR